MVRTLDSALTTALNSVTRRPALTLTIEDHVIHYAAYQNPGTGDALHDACIASDNSIVRCYVSRNSFTSTCYVQRITDPTVASQWSTWTALSGSTNIMFQDGGIAISKWPDNSCTFMPGKELAAIASITGIAVTMGKAGLVLALFLLRPAELCAKEWGAQAITMSFFSMTCMVVKR
jgi:hypothetical protein